MKRDGGQEQIEDEMRDRWRRFAREDAKFYIASNRNDWSEEDFYEHGADLVQSMLEWAGELGQDRMLEIGCGAGRLLTHFAAHFDRVDGIDIAPEMVAAASSAGLPSNVELRVGSGSDLRAYESDSFDLVFSFLVFQHIPDRAVLSRYLSEIARVLVSGGKTVLQFDTREEPVLRRLALKLPDPLLPRTRRRFIRRYPVSEEWLASQLQAGGFEVIDQRSPGTTNHQVLCRA